MIVSAIVAHAQNGIIGKEGDIPWHLPADLKYFKRTTLNHHIIMGRKTYQSIGKPLPKRTNIILTRDPFFMVSNCLIAHNIEEALELAYDNGEKEVFIAGGGEVYKQSQPYWDRIYRTLVDIEVEGDASFPEINISDWELQWEKAHHADDKNPVNYTFQRLDKVGLAEELEEKEGK